MVIAVVVVTLAMAGVALLATIAVQACVIVWTVLRAFAGRTPW